MIEGKEQKDLELCVSFAYVLPPVALSPMLARYTVEVWMLLTCCSVAGFEETNA